MRVSVPVMPWMSSIFSVTMVAIIRAKDNEDLATIVTEKMLLIQGITGTETLISYRVISSYDIESTFSLGSERI